MSEKIRQSMVITILDNKMTEETIQQRLEDQKRENIQKIQNFEDVYLFDRARSLRPGVRVKKYIDESHYTGQISNNAEKRHGKGFLFCTTCLF